MKSTKELSSKKLGTMPIFKLILNMSGPAILSMLVQALYNIVDSIFIGMYDATNGVLALSYALPMQLLINAFAIGIAVGTGSLISRLLGEGKNDDASNASQTGLLLAGILSIIFLIIGYFVADFFIKVYTQSAASNTDAADWNKVYEMGSIYLTICICCSFGFIFETMLNRILQSMGNMIIPMITQIVGAVTNIILDPIFIMVLNLGAAGAAIATVIGQIAAMCIPIIVIIKGKNKWDIDIFFKKGFKIRKRVLKPILQVALPTIVLNSVSSIMYMVSNFILNSYKDAVWAFGVYFKLNSFAFMPVFGLNQGCIPIMAYNYGAGNKERFTKTVKYAMILAFSFMFFVMALFHAMPEVFMKMFTPDTENKLIVGSEALRLCSIAFLPAAISVIMIALFNSVGHGINAMLISVVRQIGILIPLGIILVKFSSLGLTGYWTAFPISDGVVDFIFIPIMFLTVNKIFKKKEEMKAQMQVKIEEQPTLQIEKTEEN